MRNATPRNPTYTLARLMAVVTWLAVSFAVIHYLEGHGWLRTLVIACLGLGVVALLVGCLTWALERAQRSSEPAGVACLTVALFVLLIGALLVLFVALAVTLPL